MASALSQKKSIISSAGWRIWFGRVDPFALEVGIGPFQMDAKHLVGVGGHVNRRG